MDVVWAFSRGEEFGLRTKILFVWIMVCLSYRIPTQAALSSLIGDLIVSKA